MQKAEFIRILRNYIACEATEAEKKVYDDFFYSFQDEPDGLSLKTDSEREELKSEIFKKIQARISIGRASVVPPKLLLKIAATVTIVSAISLAAFLIWRQPATGYTTYSCEEGKRTVTLEDSSTVTLNAKTTLIVPRKFGSEERSVRLTGEAFFNVSPDMKRPFSVSSGELITTVVGTTFNVREFAGSPPSVSVISGAVKVQREHDSLSNEILLHPMEQVLLRDDQWQKRTIDPNDETAWVEGVLFFNDISMAEAAQMLERWYSVRVIFLQEDLKRCIVKAKYKNEPLESVLENLSIVLNMKYSIEGSTATLNGEGCD